MSAAKLLSQIKEAQYPNQSNKDTCNVYRNILYYLETRGFSILNTPTHVMKSQEFMKYISNHSHIDIFGVKETPVSSIIQVSLMFPNGKLSKIDAALCKFVETEADKLRTRPQLYKEYMIVTSAEIKGQGISRVFSLETSEEDDVNISIHETTTFAVNISSTEMFKNHSIVNITDVKDHLKEMYINEKSLPKIGNKDNMVVWLGAKIGDYIRILRPSPSSGYTVVYRKVISSE